MFICCDIRIISFFTHPDFSSPELIVSIHSVEATYVTNAFEHCDVVLIHNLVF